MCLKQDCVIILNGKPLKLVDYSIYPSSNLYSYTKFNISIYIGKSWISIDKLSTILKFDLSDKIKQELFQPVAVSLQCCGCTTWTLTKHLKKKLDGNNTRILHAVLKNPGSSTPSKQLLYRHLSPISQTIQEKQTKHARQCCRTKEKLISDVLQYTFTHSNISVGQLAKTYIHQFCVDTGYHQEEPTKSHGK